MVINGIHFTTRSTIDYGPDRRCELRCLNLVFEIQDVVMYGGGAGGFRREINLILHRQRHIERHKE